MVKKTKKSQLSSEYLIIIVSIVITGIVLFFINNMILTVNANVKELSPELNYELPLTTVHSFLYMNLNKTDKKKFKNFPNINFVKDLVWIDNSDSKKLLQEYRNKYVKTIIKASKIGNSNFLKLYNQYSNENIIPKNIITFTFDTDPSSLNDFSSLISKKNAAIPIKTQNGKITIINFK